VGSWCFVCVEWERWKGDVDVVWFAYHGHIVSRVKCIVDSYTMFSAFDVEWFGLS